MRDGTSRLDLQGVDGASDDDFDGDLRELGAADQDEARTWFERGQRQKAQKKTGGGYRASTDLYKHTLYRIETMTETQLRTRMKVIKREDKMVMFVRVLKEQGMNELATEARKALAN